MGQITSQPILPTPGPGEERPNNIADPTVGLENGIPRGPTQVQMMEDANGLYFGPHFVTNPEAQRPRSLGDTVLATAAGINSSRLQQGIGMPEEVFWTDIWNALGNVGRTTSRRRAGAEEALISQIGNPFPNNSTISAHNITTLQSSFHLKRDSLRLAKSPTGDNGKHVLEFEFDSSQQATIMVYWNVKEKITSKKTGEKNMEFLTPSDNIATPYQTEEYPSKLNQLYKSHDEFSPSEYLKFDNDNSNKTSETNGILPQTGILKTSVLNMHDMHSIINQSQGSERQNVAASQSGGVAASQSGDNSGLQLIQNEQLLVSNSSARQTNFAPSNNTSQPVTAPLTSLLSRKPSEAAKKFNTSKNTIYSLIIVISGTNTSKNGNISSEITFAQVSGKEDGHQVKVLKQKAIINGISFLLQEVYGFTDTVKDECAENMQTMRECVICMSDLKDTIVIPCRHLCLCHECAEVLRMQGRGGTPEDQRRGAARCPICRQAFHSMLQVTLPAPYAAKSRRPTCSVKSRHSLVQESMSRLMINPEEMREAALSAEQLDLSTRHLSNSPSMQLQISSVGVQFNSLIPDSMIERQRSIENIEVQRSSHNIGHQSTIPDIVVQEPHNQ